MRERPKVTGKDAERFMERVRKNNDYLEERRRRLHKAIKEAELIQEGEISKKTGREFLDEQRNKELN